MKKFGRLRNSLNKVKKPLRHVKKVKNVKWLLPGWVLYEFYNVHKHKGYNRRKSFAHGMKAEAVRLAAFASLPVPGTYELTTGGLALLKKKIEKNEVDQLNLRGFKDFIPIKGIGPNKKHVIGAQPYLRVFYKEKKLYFEIFYRKKK